MQIARESGVKRLALCHYAPEFDDGAIDGVVEAAQREFHGDIGAREGQEINVSPGAAPPVPLTRGRERRRERRYALHVLAVVEWKTPEGKTVRSHGVMKNVSKFGVYFIASRETRMDLPLEVVAVLPTEITRCGDFPVRYRAHPVWQKPVPWCLGGAYGSCVGIAGRVIA